MHTNHYLIMKLKEYFAGHDVMHFVNRYNDSIVGNLFWDRFRDRLYRSVGASLTLERQFFRWTKYCKNLAVNCYSSFQKLIRRGFCLDGSPNPVVLVFEEWLALPAYRHVYMDYDKYRSTGCICVKIFIYVFL